MGLGEGLSKQTFGKTAEQVQLGIQAKAWINDWCRATMLVIANYMTGVNIICSCKLMHATQQVSRPLNRLVFKFIIVKSAVQKYEQFKREPQSPSRSTHNQRNWTIALLGLLRNC